MTQKSAFAAPAAAHDDEDITSVDREVEITLNDEVAIRHRQVLDRDMRFPLDILAWIAHGGGPPPQFHFSHIFRVVQITVAVASMTMISRLRAECLQIVSRVYWREPE